MSGDTTGDDHGSCVLKLSVVADDCAIFTRLPHRRPGGPRRSPAQRVASKLLNGHTEDFRHRCKFVIRPRWLAVETTHQGRPGHAEQPGKISFVEAMSPHLGVHFLSDAFPPLRCHTRHHSAWG